MLMVRAVEQGANPCSGPLFPISSIPMSSISNIGKKRSRGRPPTDATPVMVRIVPDQLATLDAWIARQPDPKPSRPEAIRRLAQMSLEGSEAPPTQSEDIMEGSVARSMRPRLQIDDVE